MATAAEIALVRDYIRDTATPYLVSDELVTLFIDEAAGDINIAVARGWRQKAAAYADLYDVTIDGRTFNRSQAHKMAMAQAALFENAGAAELASVRMIGPSDPDMYDEEDSEFA